MNQFIAKHEELVLHFLRETIVY